jgi:sortase A
MSRIHIHRVASRASRTLLAAGVLALGYVAYVTIDASAYQADQRRILDEARDRTPVVGVGHQDGTAARPAAAVPREGDSIGVIEIPRLGIDVAVVQGDSGDLLERAVGHVSDTALPGETGNVVLAGHRDTFFRPLEHVRVGDTMTVKTVRGDFHYVVESTIVVMPDDLWVLVPIGGRTITLITCFPFAYVGAAPERFVVRARETPAPPQDAHVARR